MNTGFAFHLHHDKLWEWCENFEGRVTYIRMNKPSDELNLRIRLFQMIPPDRVPQALSTVETALDEAGTTYNKWAEYDEVWTAYDEAWTTYDEWYVYDKARAACESEMIALHAELCPDCPWDGTTIFPKGDEHD